MKNKPKHYVVVCIEASVWKAFDRLRRKAGHTTRKSAVTEMIRRCVANCRVPQRRD